METELGDIVTCGGIKNSLGFYSEAFDGMIIEIGRKEFQYDFLVYDWKKKIIHAINEGEFLRWGPEEE